MSKKNHPTTTDTPVINLPKNSKLCITLYTSFAFVLLLILLSFTFIFALVFITSLIAGDLKFTKDEADNIIMVHLWILAAIMGIFAFISAGFYGKINRYKKEVTEANIVNLKNALRKSMICSGIAIILLVRIFLVSPVIFLILFFIAVPVMIAGSKFYHTLDEYIQKNSIAA